MDGALFAAAAAGLSAVLFRTATAAQPAGVEPEEISEAA